jgi:hypothetical protein
MSESDRLYEPNISYTIDSPGGRYTAPWHPAEIKPDGIGMTISRRALQSVGTGAVTMHFSFVATRLSPGAAQTVIAAPRFTIPGGGSCVLLEGFARNNMHCRYAFENVMPTLVTGTIASGTCEQPGATKTFTTTLRTMQAGTREDPVVQIPIYLGGSVCPGVKVTFVPYHQAGSLRLELDAKPVDLSSFRDE